MIVMTALNSILLLGSLVGLATRSHAAEVIDYPMSCAQVSGWDQVLTIAAGAEISPCPYPPRLSPISLDVSAYTATVNITGGVLRGGISVAGYDNVFNISGGNIGGAIETWAWGSVINVYGWNLALVGTPNGGTITGWFSDNSPISIALIGGGDTVVNLILGDSVSDHDNDGVVDSLDNCPVVPNPLQIDCNGDGLGDACELDCNLNGIDDDCDITAGTSTDFNRNGIVDDCECLADISGNHIVNGVDISVLLGAWGTNGSEGEFDADVTNDGIVNGADLAIMLGGWGPCPN